MKIRNLVILITLPALILLSGCERQESSAGRPAQQLAAVQVTAARVARHTADNQVEVVGTIEAVLQAEVSAKVTGNIIAIPVEPGSKVKEGDLLAEVSAEEISAQLQEAKAQLEQVRRNLAREENLLKKNAATLETVKSLEDRMRITEAAYRTALAMLDFTRITAPFAGTVTRKLASVGDLATPGKPLLHIEEGSRLQVLTDIPEAMVEKVSKGDKLKVFVPSVDLTVEGTVSEVSPTADPSSRTSPIKLRIADNPRLRSGQFARVTLAMNQAETLMVPASAVVPFGQMERVFIISEDGKARLRLVRSGARSNGNIEILSGLVEGETVAATGNSNLRDGQPVIIQ